MNWQIVVLVIWIAGVLPTLVYLLYEQMRSERKGKPLFPEEDEPLVAIVFTLIWPFTWCLLLAVYLANRADAREDERELMRKWMEEDEDDA